MSSEHARITNSKQHLLTVAVSDVLTQWYSLLHHFLLVLCSQDYWHYWSEDFAFCTILI